jgi:hypothetical protein
MGRSVTDLELMARVLFGELGGREAYFPAPVPYRDVTLPEKLRLGYYLNGASSLTLINVGLVLYTLKQMVWLRDLLFARGLYWKLWKHFAGKGMNASRSMTPQMVREEATLRLMENPSSGSSCRGSAAIRCDNFCRRV